VCDFFNEASHPPHTRHPGLEDASPSKIYPYPAHADVYMGEFSFLDNPIGIVSSLQKKNLSIYKGSLHHRRSLDDDDDADDDS
jgi:hypothetical protein